ncbi:hypothetical protein DFQ28_002834 [Apophysomyces sp. BC1034]|nr:hypothetical protein DFQ30_003101 [Apophysomyces sp. BC1015]KAG0179486.1 hypothetical protein DFQ29_002030 [Apophysomyces sp. BC1021]KAG0189859.1 hypothetical protein DFQ28_002834 [Apophysomyces sp. BC1034]
MNHRRSLLLLLLALVSTVLAQDVLVINHPAQNEQWSNNREFPIDYTIVGGQTTNPPFDANYPNSLTVYFQWAKHGDGSNPLRLTAIQSLETSPYPAGVQNQQYHQKWKTPNCHFFSRYPPSSYDFSLYFEPSYLPAAPNATSVSNGPQQQPITVNLNIQVSNETFPKC